MLVLDVPAEREEELIGLLSSETIGVEVLPGRAGLRRLKLYHDTLAQAHAAARRAAELFPFGGPQPWPPLRVETVHDGHWVERYQAGLAPFAVGQRFTVVPGGQAAAAPGRARAASERTPIVLVPGRAFGTGEHPTTRLCVMQLERQVRPGRRWLDLGCGSGILALVAHHCGASPVLALDCDAEAVEVAREALQANGLAQTIELRVGQAGDLPLSCWDGIVANVDAGLFKSCADELATLLAPRGLLIASGFLTHELRTVRQSLRRSGFTVLAQETLAGWSALTAVVDG